MTITEIISKYKPIIVKPEPGVEKLYFSPAAREALTVTDVNFIMEHKDEIISEIKRIENEKKTAPKKTNKFVEYNKIWNDGGEGYNPYEDEAPVGKYRNDTYDNQD